MNNWTHITADHLKALGHGAIVDKAGTVATGGIDPIAEVLAEATARVRGACAAGNALDLDAGKVPNSLRGLTARLALHALMERIGLALSPAQQRTRASDEKWLERIAEQKTRFEAPDDPAGSAEMQPQSALETLTSTPRDRYSREGTSGL